jgi:hypothetical protein
MLRAYAWLIKEKPEEKYEQAVAFPKSFDSLTILEIIKQKQYVKKAGVCC